MGSTITLTSSDGFQLSAYQAEPEGPARGGVVVVQEIFGVNDHIKDVADRVGGVILVTPPTATAQLVREVADAGIRRVWMQQGAESDEAVRYCEQHGVKVVHHQCILMFSEPAAFPHRFHRGLVRLFGRLPS